MWNYYYDTLQLFIWLCQKATTIFFFFFSPILCPVLKLNVYCSGDDRYGYEKASERWLPIHTVETILISVISMLADPNDESPANVDAAKEWREAYPEFK